MMIRSVQESFLVGTSNRKMFSSKDLIELYLFLKDIYLNAFKYTLDFVAPPNAEDVILLRNVVKWTVHNIPENGDAVIGMGVSISECKTIEIALLANDEKVPFQIGLITLDHNNVVPESVEYYPNMIDLRKKIAGYIEKMI